MDPPRARAVRFRYQALHPDGTTEHGDATAQSRTEVLERLTARGLFPVEIQEKAHGWGQQGRIEWEVLARGFRILASILTAGVPMERALSVFADVAPTGWSRDAIDSIRDATREGAGLARGLDACPMAIPAFVIGIVESGEANGALAPSLLRAAEELETNAATRNSIRSALAYPLVLAVSSLLSVTILVTVVIPRFAAILSDLGQQLPLSTRIVLGFAVAARSSFVPVLFVGLVCWVLFWRWRSSSPHAAIRWAEMLLRVPIVGRLRFMLATARISSTLGALLSSGVAMPAALSHAARAAGDPALSTRILLARARVLGGERLSSALLHVAGAPAGTIQLAKAGEATGELAQMLAYAARLERERAEQELKRLVRMIEPGLILIFGVMVALVAAALLQAVYSVRPTI